MFIWDTCVELFFLCKMCIRQIPLLRYLSRIKKTKDSKKIIFNSCNFVYIKVTQNLILIFERDCTNFFMRSNYYPNSIIISMKVSCFYQSCYCYCFPPWFVYVPPFKHILVILLCLLQCIEINCPIALCKLQLVLLVIMFKLLLKFFFILLLLYMLRFTLCPCLYV